MEQVLTVIAAASFAVAFVAGFVAVWTWPNDSDAASFPASGADVRQRQWSGEAPALAHPVFDLEVTR